MASASPRAQSRTSRRSEPGVSPLDCFAFTCPRCRVAGLGVGLQCEWFFVIFAIFAVLQSCFHRRERKERRDRRPASRGQIGGRGRVLSLEFARWAGDLGTGEKMTEQEHRKIGVASFGPHCSCRCVGTHQSSGEIGHRSLESGMQTQKPNHAAQRTRHSATHLPRFHGPTLPGRWPWR